MSPAAERWGWGKTDLPFQHLQALLAFGCHPEQKGGKTCAAATLWTQLCLLPRALVTHAAALEDYTATIITLYLPHSLYIAIPYLKGVLCILKGNSLITCKAITSLTHLLELGSHPLSIYY